jgi:pimeloyl-ACP methyl ester carboxylesterase
MVGKETMARPATLHYLIVFATLVAPWTPVGAADIAATSRFEPARCWFNMTDAPNARCGRLYVPENRAAADSRTIALAVVVLPPDGATAGAEPNPVVYLSGGPGYGSGIDADGVAGWLSWRAGVSWLLDRTLVLIDPRGTGLSEPLMACPEITDAYYAHYAHRPEPGRKPGSEDNAAQTALWREAGTACRDRLTGSGIDLAAYDSAASAADLADLRRALGYREWDVWGVSYGTRVALALMRDHPQGIRTAILDSLYPPEAMGYAGLASGTEGAFRQLFTDCAADPGCARAYPDLEDDLARTLAWLDERPITFPVTRPDTGAKTRVVLDGETFLDILFGDFYDWERITFLPDIIGSAARRDIPFLRSYAEWLAESLADPDFSEGLQLSMECREEFPFNPKDQMRAGPAAAPFEGFGLPRLELAICPLWGAGTADAIETAPVTSPIPTLVLAGLYDPITPPAWARAAMAGLAHGFLVEFPGIGHAVIDNDSCADDVVGDFLAKPDERPDPSCLRRLGPPNFDIYVPEEEEDGSWERRT